MIRPARAAVAPLAALAAALCAVGVYLALRQPGRSTTPAPDEKPAITVQSSATPLVAPTGPLPVLRAIPEFHLSAASGEEIGREELLGRPWVAGFIFTTCAGACPLMMAEMVRLHDSLPADRPVRMVAITVDPAHDTAEVLRDYAVKFGATGERWRFLRGSASETYALAQQGFQLAAGPSADPSQGDGPFFHSDRLVLVDAQGNVRGYYRGTEAPEIDRLRHDLNRLAAGA
jgi:cytochrome oxidase Cu insertion factor (SCO1/SenC/PrrC family)